MVVHRRDGRSTRRCSTSGSPKLRERGRRRARDQLGRTGDRDAVLHGAGAGARRGSRRARRHLQPGRDAVPRAHRRAAVRRAVADERAVEAPHRRRRAAARPRARAVRCRPTRIASCCARWRRPSRIATRRPRRCSRISSARSRRPGAEPTSVATVALRAARRRRRAPRARRPRCRSALRPRAQRAWRHAPHAAAAATRRGRRRRGARHLRGALGLGRASISAEDGEYGSACVAPTSTTTNGRCAASDWCDGWCCR